MDVFWVGTATGVRFSQGSAKQLSTPTESVQLNPGVSKNRGHHSIMTIANHIITAPQKGATNSIPTFHSCLPSAAGQARHHCLCWKAASTSLALSTSTKSTSTFT